MNLFQSIILSWLFFSTSLFSQSVFIGEVSNVYSGEEIKVPVEIHNLFAFSDAIDFTLKFDPAMLAGLRAEINTELVPGFQVLGTTVSEGEITVRISGNTSYWSGENGTLVFVYFLVKGAVNDIIEIQFSEVWMNFINYAHIGHSGKVIVEKDECFKHEDQLSCEAPTRWYCHWIDDNCKDNDWKLNISSNLIEDGVSNETSTYLGIGSNNTDGWRYGEDEYNRINSSTKYIDLYFNNPHWQGEVDQNNNENVCCDDLKFETDMKSVDLSSNLKQWDINAEFRGIPSEVTIPIKWNFVSSLPEHFHLYLYVGEESTNMRTTGEIELSQADLILTTQVGSQVKIFLGGCAGTALSNPNCFDCENIPYGNAYLDYCGQCINPDIGETACAQNCAEEWGGNAVMDGCGVCDSDNSNNNLCFDCNADPNGTAFIDNCGDCVQGNTGVEPCQMDCMGVWDGNATDAECGICSPPDTEDNCGVCDSDASNDCQQDCRGTWGGFATLDNCGVCDSDSGNDNQCYDCNNQPNGIDGIPESGDEAFIDNCGICVEGDTNLTPCSQDCNGDWGGTAYRDECNQCIKNPSDACVQDCNNIWGGLAYVDGCGVCDSNPANDCIQDCNGEWGGTAYLDNCSICVGGNSGNSACVQDCNGTWGGTASGNECVDCFPPSTRDNCGVCTGGSTGNEPCSQDCAGVWGGLAELDNCGTCSGGDSGNIANAEMDCNNDCNGSAMINNCGECIGGNTGVEDSCAQDCQGVWGGPYTPTFHCQDGSIVCSISDCELLTIDQLIEIPQSFGIHKVFPNPFNPITTIEYTMNSASYYALTLYNIQGQKVANLAEGFSPAGKYRIQWNGKDFPSGIYFVILSSPHSIEKQKIMLIK